MWCGGRIGKPLGCVRQVDCTLQIELGVVTKTRHFFGSAIAGASDGDSYAEEHGKAGSAYRTNRSLPADRPRNLVCSYFFSAKPRLSQNIPCVLPEAGRRLAGGSKLTIEPDGTGNSFQSSELGT